jgi:hypothetical protein
MDGYIDGWRDNQIGCSVPHSTGSLGLAEGTHSLWLCLVCYHEDGFSATLGQAGLFR